MSPVKFLCWQVAGMFLRVLSWPMGFIVLAKGRAAVLFWTDLAAYSVYVALGWFGLKLFGLPGTGMAFLGLYIFHWCMIFAVVRRMSGFSWSPCQCPPLGARSYHGWPSRSGSVSVCQSLGRQSLDVALALMTGLYCLRTLVLLVGVEEINKYTRKMGFSLPLRKASGIPKAAAIASKE